MVSATLPLLVVMPVTPLATSTVTLLESFLNEKPCPAAETVPATVPTALAFVNVTAFFALAPRPAATIEPPDWPIVPAETKPIVPVPAPIFCAIVRSPDVATATAMLPLFVAIPVTPFAIPTVRPTESLLNAKALPAPVTEAATVPMAFALVSDVSLTDVAPRPAAVSTPPD